MEDNHWKYERPSNSLIQNVKDGLPNFTATNLLLSLAFACIVTRFISGIRGRQRVYDPAVPRTSRLAPYWFPWFGHTFFFTWDHAGLFKSLR